MSKRKFYGNESNRTSAMRKKLRLYASAHGGSVSSVAEACGMSSQALYNWIKAEPKFGETMERCLQRGNEREEQKKGPPSKLTPENKTRIEQIAALDGSVLEMAYYCDVTPQTIYNWIGQDKDLFNRIERLRAKPILAARQRVIKDLNTPEGARWFLSKNRRAREDFGEHATVDLTTNKDDKAKIQTKNSLLDNIFSKKK